MPKGKCSKAARKARSDLRAARFQARQSRALVKSMKTSSDGASNSVPTLTDDPRDKLSCVHKIPPVLPTTTYPNKEIQIEDDDILIIPEEFSDFD